MNLAAGGCEGFADALTAESMRVRRVLRALRTGKDTRVASPYYVGDSTFLRVWPPGMILLAVVVLTGAGANGTSFAVLFSLSAAVVARLLPWRFDVLEDGIELSFAFGRRRFLSKTETTIAVGIGGAVARRRNATRCGYPLTDGFVESRRLVLRSVLLEHGFDVA